MKTVSVEVVPFTYEEERFYDRSMREIIHRQQILAKKNVVPGPTKPTESAVRNHTRMTMTSPSQLRRHVDSSASERDGGSSIATSMSSTSQSIHSEVNTPVSAYSPQIEMYFSGFVDRLPKETAIKMLLVWEMHMRPDLNCQVLALHSGKKLQDRKLKCKPPLRKQPLRALQAAVKNDSTLTCRSVKRRMRNAVLWVMDHTPGLEEYFGEIGLEVNALDADDLMSVSTTLFVCHMEKFADEDVEDIHRQITEIFKKNPGTMKHEFNVQNMYCTT